MKTYYHLQHLLNAHHTHTNYLISTQQQRYHIDNPLRSLEYIKYKILENFRDQSRRQNGSHCRQFRMK